MTVLQITVPEQKEKAVRILLKELGVSIKKVSSDNNQLLKNIKTAVTELNDIKAGKTEAKNLDDY